jgi:hypothetical protein
MPNCSWAVQQFCWAEFAEEERKSSGEISCKKFLYFLVAVIFSQEPNKAPSLLVFPTLGFPGYFWCSHFYVLGF